MIFNMTASGGGGGGGDGIIVDMFGTGSESTAQVRFVDLTEMVVYGFYVFGGISGGDPKPTAGKTSGILFAEAVPGTVVAVWNDDIIGTTVVTDLGTGDPVDTVELDHGLAWIQTVNGTQIILAEE